MKTVISLLFISLWANCVYSNELLQEDINRDLGYINHPSRKWVKPRLDKSGSEILNVAIIGGGQTGLTMAFSLQRHHVDGVKVFDLHKEDHAGSWINIGKMNTLRTPKSTTGPDLGIPSLSVQSWYSAKYGKDAWEKLTYIPRLSWHDYLNWYRTVLNLPVQFESYVHPLEWNEEMQCFSFKVTTPKGESVIFARKVILAVGLEGSGEWMIPDFIKRNVSKKCYTQAVYRATPEQLKGKDIAILGAGPNAFDLTLVSKKCGAKSITMFSKRKKLVNLHCFKWGEFTGFMKCFSQLDDDQKYSFIARMHEMGQPPIPKCVEAAYSYPNFNLRFSSPWKNAYQKGDRVVVVTKDGEHEYDFLILATGWVADLTKRKELANFCDKIATWEDKYTPPKGRRYDKLMKFPYLGKGFQFVEKAAGEAPYLNSLFNMTGGGLLSNGFCAGTGLTGMKYSIDHITQEIVSQFFLEDADTIYDSLDSYSEYDFQN
ncbi:MAG: SidA/IucD/PvdA family monooxygenase [Rhabdochlamydiaceae bacterium]|nr:SidA/IucD/PvdA family monooxygenase [Candidatus Amphrikana amoebophyrae]